MNKYVIGFFVIMGLAIANVDEKDISIQNLRGKVTECDVQNNQHFRRVPIVEEDHVYLSDTFILVKGNPDYSSLLRIAVPLTDGQIRTSEGGHTFRLNDLGQSIRHRDTDSLRGVRKLDNEAARILGRKISESNPELEPILKRIPW